MLALRKRLKRTGDEFRQFEAQTYFQARDSVRRIVINHWTQARRYGNVVEGSPRRSGFFSLQTTPHRSPFPIQSRSTQNSLSTAPNRLTSPPSRRTRKRTFPQHVPSLSNLSICRSGSGSRIPPPVAPVHSGTPSLSHDPNSTNSSLVSSIFSSRSVKTKYTPARSASSLFLPYDGEEMSALRVPS